MSDSLTTSANAIIPPLSSLPRRSSSNARSPRMSAQRDVPDLLPRKYSNASEKPLALDESVINELEWEEERLVNQLTQKLEKLRADKARLENDLEAESEAMVHKLQKQLKALQQEQAAFPDGSSPESPLSPALHLSHLSHPPSEMDPALVVDILKQENSTLREKLAMTETTHVKISRLNDVYRSELIHLRSRLGLDVSDLVGVPANTAIRKQTSLDRNASRDRTVSFSSSSLVSNQSSHVTTSSEDSTSPHTSETTPSTSYVPPVPHTTPSTSYSQTPSSPQQSIRFISSPSPSLDNRLSNSNSSSKHPCDMPDRPGNYRVAETGRLMYRGRSRSANSQEGERMEQSSEMSPVLE